VSGGSEHKRDSRWTVAELLNWTKERFEKAGIDSPRVDAEHLLAHALGCTRMELYTQHDRLLAPEDRGDFRDYVKRRLAREPVAYIEGARGFHALDLDLSVDRRVLIPRPDTEHLVDWVLEDWPPPPAPPLPIIDVGTGSGAIALAIKKARPEALVHACDLSTDALDVARANASQHALEVEFHHSDLLDSVPKAPGGWRVVAANLPYIPAVELDSLMPEVRQYEPLSALDGGDDGLDLVRRLIDQCAPAQGRMSPRGAIYLEIGIHQAETTAELLRAAGYADVDIRDDYGGIGRVVRGRI
jgi:release factor glutamine methyltransferase